MTIKALATIMLSLTGWGWSIRAGLMIARYRQSRTPFMKRVAIGNTLVGLLPLALVVFINWA